MRVITIRLPLISTILVMVLLVATRFSLVTVTMLPIQEANAAKKCNSNDDNVALATTITRR